MTGLFGAGTRRSGGRWLAKCGAARTRPYACPGPSAARGFACLLPNRPAATARTITWRELGGPPIKAPVKYGYGSSLIRDLIPHEVGGTVGLVFASDGACCEIEIPLGGR